MAGLSAISRYSSSRLLHLYRQQMVGISTRSLYLDRPRVENTCGQICKIELGSPLGTEPLDMFGEEERDVLHQLLARQVVVARHLQRAQHLQRHSLYHGVVSS